MTLNGLERLGRFGPFFAVDPMGSSGPNWLPLATMATEAVLGPRIVAVREALAASAGSRPDQVEPRVAASIAQLGLSARLLSVALAARVDGLAVPAPDRWVFQDRLGGPYPLGVLAGGKQGSRDQASGPGWPADAFALVEPVAAVVREGGYGLSPKVIRGNLASALAGAATMITTAEPAAGALARALVEEALSSPQLTGSGRFVDDHFRRRSCCLIYRLYRPPTEPIFCGDCVLAAV